MVVKKDGFEISKEELEEIKKDHFERQVEEGFVEEAEVEGLALNLVELDEMHYKLVEGATEIKETLDKAQAMLDQLKSDEEEVNG